MTRSGALRQRRRRLPRDQWEVLIPDHHPGFTDWDTYQANQARIGTNIRPQASQPGTGAVREGCALLQGLATCGTCGRKLAIFYTGPAKMRAELLLPGLGRAGQRPRRPAHERRRAGHRRRRRRRVPGRAGPRRAGCVPASRPPARRRPRRRPGPAPPPGRAGPLPRQPGPSAATGPSTRTTGWSPAGWKPNGNTALRELADAEAELARRETARPKTLTPQEKQAILALGDDLGAVWDAPTTTDKDRKQLLRTLLDEVNITLRRDDPGPHAGLVLRWKGGAISELTVPLRRRAARRSAPTRTPST